MMNVSLRRPDSFLDGSSHINTSINDELTPVRRLNGYFTVSRPRANGVINGIDPFRARNRFYTSESDVFG